MGTEQETQALSVSAQRGLVEQSPVGGGDEAGGTPQKGGLKIGVLLRTLQRRAWLIAGLFILAFTAAKLRDLRKPPNYSGRFDVLVEPASRQQKLSDPSSVARGAVQDPGELDYATQFEILTSPKLLNPIVDQVKKKYPKFTFGQLASRLELGRVAVEGVGSGTTKILRVSYSSSDPELVEYVLEVTAQRFLRYSLEERKTYIGEGVKFIEEQLPAVQNRVDSLQQNLQNLQQQYQLINPETQGGDLYERFQTTINLQQDTQNQLREVQATYVTLINQLQLSPEEAIAASALSQDPGYQQLIGRVLELETQLALNSVRFEPESPNIQALEEQKQSLLPVLNQEAERILGASLSQFSGNPQVLSSQNQVRLRLIDQLIDAANQIQLLEVRSQSLAQVRDDLAQQVKQFPTISRRYGEIRRQLEIATRTLDQLLAQRETLRIEVAQNQVPWEIISEPSLPRDKSGQPVPEEQDSKKVLFVAVAGLVLGIGMALLWEKYRNIYYTIEDVKDTLSVPVLGVIPRYVQLEKGSDAVLSLPGDLVANDSPEALEFWNAFESLYANLRFLFAEAPIRSLAVCSAMAGDGKSTIAQYLAQTVAGMGQRVLLVDANLRLPDIHQRLKVSNTKGLTDFLVDHIDPTHLIQQSPVASNMFVLPSGQPTATAQRLLASNQMQTLRTVLEANFDLVIYDTPNLMGPIDATFLAAYTDGVVMVMAMKETKQSLFKETIDQLEKFRLPVLGVVVNHLKKRGLIAKLSSPDDSDQPGSGMPDALEEANHWKLPEFSNFSTVLKVNSGNPIEEKDKIS